jgi:isoleucyl-tRNA synthetase
MNTNKKLSVHLTGFPKYDETLIDTHLEHCMLLAQQSSSMILALRRKADKKVRQPLQRAVIPVTDAHTGEALQYVAELIKAEVNIKELEIVSADDTSFALVKKIKPNFKTLGKKYGKQMKEIAAAIELFSQEDIASLEKTGICHPILPSGAVEIAVTDVEIATEDMPGWLVANEGNLTVALDVTVTPALYREGIARELINRIQNLRKTNGYEITDKIHIRIEHSPEITPVVEEYTAYIAAQVLATHIRMEQRLDEAITLDLEDFAVKITVEKNIG